MIRIFNISNDKILFLLIVYSSCHCSRLVFEYVDSCETKEARGEFLQGIGLHHYGCGIFFFVSCRVLLHILLSVEKLMIQDSCTDLGAIGI
jgi:hypothetical protein